MACFFILRFFAINWRFVLWFHPKGENQVRRNDVKMIATWWKWFAAELGPLHGEHFKRGWPMKSTATVSLSEVEITENRGRKLAPHN
jgi:hypothetical protein